jgi:hypothetical protein
MLRFSVLLLLVSTLAACGGGQSLDKVELAPEDYLRCVVHVDATAPDAANVSLELKNLGPDGVSVLLPSTSTITWMLDHGRKVMDISGDDRATTMNHLEVRSFKDAIMIPSGAVIESAALRTGRIPDVLTCPVQ